MKKLIRFLTAEKFWHSRDVEGRAALSSSRRAGLANHRLGIACVARRGEDTVALPAVVVLMALVWMFAVAGAGAATVVSGNVSGTWTTNGSPYILSADCTVASNQTLTIQPGVEVIIGPNVFVDIFGGITAVGTPEQRITIRGASPTNYWPTLRIWSRNLTITNRFHYCQIRDWLYAALQPTVYNTGRMSVEIVNCDFSNGADAVYCVVGDVNSPSASLSLDIHNSIFESLSYGCVLHLDNLEADANARITGNIFKNLKYAALSLSGDSTNSSQRVFLNNTVFKASQGVVNTIGRNGVEPVIRNNLFVNTSNAVYRNFVVANADVSYNCFFNNTANFIGYPGVYGVPVQNNHNGSPCDAFFNIFLDPRFLDTNTFLLSNFSPCIDAGDPAIADVCFQFSHGSAISDIGAYGGPDACGWLTHGFAPVITGAPADQSSCVGGSATFKVRAEGSEPLGYRWYFNRTNLLAGETNAQLNLVNLQTNLAGLYSAAVSNAFGSVTSAPARLLVFDACVGINLYAGLSITGLVGRTYALESATNLGATNWTLVATNTFTTPRWLFIDTNTPFNPGNFFRVRLLP